MHAPALYRDTRNPADDVPPSQLADLVPETDWFASLPDWALPDPPLDLSRFVVTVSLPAIATSDAALRALAERHPAEFAHAQAAVAAKHGPACREHLTTWDYREDAHVTLGQIAREVRGWRREGFMDLTLTLTLDGVQLAGERRMPEADAESCVDEGTATAEVPMREAADDMLAEQAMPDDTKAVA